MKHNPQLYAPEGPISGVNETYTIAFIGCSCGWNSDGKAVEEWSDHLPGAKREEPASSGHLASAAFNAQASNKFGAAREEPAVASRHKKIDRRDGLIDCSCGAIAMFARDFNSHLLAVSELREALQDLLNNYACSCMAIAAPCPRCKIAVDEARALLSASPTPQQQGEKER